MDRSYPSARRIAHRIRFRRRMMLAVSAAIAFAAVAFALFAAPATGAAAAPDLDPPFTLALTVPAAAAPVPAAARPVYRHSVVPGGAGDAAELARAVRRDKVVAAHYAGFAVDRARAMTVRTARAVHVSYRKGDQVYWTAKKAILRPGETLLTDGGNEMRARCANRISDVPRLPVEANGPGPETLDELEGEGGLAWVNAPGPDELDLPEPGRAFPIVWGDSGTPPAAKPPRVRTPVVPAHSSGLPWPRMGWIGGPGLPPLAGAVPALPPAPPAGEPPGFGLLPAPPLLASFEPQSDPSPFVPPPDPGRQLPPSNPPLDLAPPAGVSEPASAWLAAVAALAMCGVRRRVES